MGNPAVIVVELTSEERDVLRRGFGEWGGPASPTDDLARAIGFDDVQDLRTEGDRIAAAITAGEGLSPLDWTRALLALEVVFASDVLGSGIDWSMTTRWTDGETMILLRGLQRRLRAARAIVSPRRSR